MEAKRWHPEGDADEGVYSRVQAGVIQGDCASASEEARSSRAVNNSLANLYRCFNVTTIQDKKCIPRLTYMHSDITFTIRDPWRFIKKNL